MRHQAICNRAADLRRGKKISASRRGGDRTSHDSRSAGVAEVGAERGQTFGLDIYGLDLLETDNGPVIVDINDFPGFGGVPDAPRRVADYILQLAQDRRPLRRVGDRKPLVRGGRSETGVAVRAEDYEPYRRLNGARAQQQRAGRNGSGKIVRLSESVLRAREKSVGPGASLPEIRPSTSSGS